MLPENSLHFFIYLGDDRLLSPSRREIGVRGRVVKYYPGWVSESHYFEMFCSLRWTFQFCKLMIKKGFEGKKVAPPHRILNEETVFLIPGQCPTQNLPLIIGDI